MKKYKIILGEIYGYFEYKIPCNRSALHRSALHRLYGNYIDDICSIYFSSLFYSICMNADDVVRLHLSNKYK